MRLGRLGPTAAATAFLPPIGFLILLGTMNQSAPWLQSHGALGVVLFVAAFSVLGGLALLPTYAPSVLGGWRTVLTAADAESLRRSARTLGWQTQKPIRVLGPDGVVPDRGAVAPRG